MKIRHLVTGAVALTVLGIASIANASSHREAPAISNDPSADNTDLWAWAPATHDKLIVVASYIPLEEPSGGPNYNKFSDDVLYEIHVTKGNVSLADAVTYQIRFTTAPIARVDPADHTKGAGGGKEFYAQISGYYNQTYSVTKVVGGVPTVVATGVDVAPPNIGPRTMAAWKAFNFYPKASGAGVLGATPAYDDAFFDSFVKSTASEGKFFAGQTDDGFYVDLARTFDLANFAGSLTTPVQPARDNVAGFNCHTIALEIPASVILGHTPAVAGDADTVGVWASASRKKTRILRNDGTEENAGPWIQVSRLGFPLINEAVIGIQDKDKYNRTTPATDVQNFGAYFLNPVVATDAFTVGVLTQAQADVSSGKNGARTDILDVLNIKNFPTAGAHNIPLTATGDVLRVDMGTTSAFPNGRPIPGGVNQEAPVTDIELSLLIIGPASQLNEVKQGASKNDKLYRNTFPYLALPWEGAREGHGVGGQ